jgi:4-amino-4-deoxy-L-arabinose transferase-like glycosyltransferase
MFWLFGQTVQIARLPGILCGVISIMMIYLICSLSLRSNSCEQFRWPLMITFLYATTPAVIQGSAIIDIDMTILIPSILLMFLFFLKYEQTGDYRWAVLTGLAVSIAFWARVTTPPVIALLLMLYTLSTKKDRSHKLIIVGSILAGCLMFTGSWYIYCTITDIPFSAPFTYTSQSFFTKMMRADFSLLSNIVQNLTSFILWFGILPFLLLILVTWHRCTAFLKDYSLHEEDIFLIGGLILIGGYTLIGGSTFGYPKYQIPAISLIMIYFGINASRHENSRFHPHLKTIFIAVVSSAVMQVFLTGDILYDFRYSFREAEAFMLPVSKEIMMGIIVRIFVFIILSAVLIIFLVKFSSSKSYYYFP